MLQTFSSFFEYLTSCHESLLTKHPHAEVLYIGDLNVHHTDWLQSTHTDVGGIEAFHFSISNELEQNHHTSYTCFLIVMTIQQTLLTYSLLLTLRTILTLSPLLCYTLKHCTVLITSSFTPPPPIPSTQRYLWHFENARHADMSNFLWTFHRMIIVFGLVILTWQLQQLARSWIRE